jgi:thiamine-monophosphate kinase
MLTEKEIICLFLKQLPKNDHHCNEFFESDAEIIIYNGGKFLFTTDEFSQEDLFRDHDPYVLGWNVVVCTISDILASGGQPKFYAQTVQIAKHWNKSYIEEFARGVSEAIIKSHATFIGGDLGSGTNWHYTGICIGEASNAITRKGASPGDTIFITGEVGAGNLEAALSLYSENKSINEISTDISGTFKLRLNESALIKDFASSCIDTSDGVLSGINTLADINKVGYRMTNIPYIHEGKLVCTLLSKPTTLLFMGECGEYELLFTVPEEKTNTFLDLVDKYNYPIHKIGLITKAKERTLEEDRKLIDFQDFNISARSFENVKDYLNELFKYVSS